MTDGRQGEVRFRLDVCVHLRAFNIFYFLYDNYRVEFEIFNEIIHWVVNSHKTWVRI